MSDITLAIEISNPSSGPRGLIVLPGSDEPIAAGPGVALGRLGEEGRPELIGVELLGEAAHHDDDLMPAIDRLCRRSGVRPGDLGHIAVSIGPGGYTSLRIAIATAKMLAEATSAGTIPVQSAAVAAWLAEPITPALVCLASKGSTAWCALLPPPGGDQWWRTAGGAALGGFLDEAQNRFEHRTGRNQSWIARMAPLGLLDASAITSLQPRLIIADRFLPQPMREAAAHIGAKLAEPVFSATSVLEIAAGMEDVDPLALAPLYPREAEAVVQWRRRSAES